jgi:hypothetical protein
VVQRLANRTASADQPCVDPPVPKASKAGRIEGRVWIGAAAPLAPLYKGKEVSRRRRGVVVAEPIIVLGLLSLVVVHVDEVVHCVLRAVSSEVGLTRTGFTFYFAS